MTTVPVVLIVDGAEYPVDLGAINARQVSVMRARGISPADLVTRLDTDSAELPEVVVLMGISLEQRDRPSDYEWLSRRVTLGSEVEIRYEGNDAAGASADVTGPNGPNGPNDRLSAAAEVPAS